MGSGELTRMLHICSYGRTSSCSAIQGSGAGLKGEYYRGTSLGTLVLSRTDATVGFNWGTGSPASAISADNFSVRWTGHVSPRYSGSTTFYTQSDDGIRLYEFTTNATWTGERLCGRSELVSLTGKIPASTRRPFAPARRRRARGSGAVGREAVAT